MTGTLGEIFIRYFVRYFVPGAVFYLSVVFLPLQLFLNAATNPINLTSSDVAVMGSIIFGYLLDSIGAYAWHANRKEYIKEKRQLALDLKEVSRLIISRKEKTTKSSDPDFHSITLWLKDKELYDRITVERAEWVAILESSFSLSIGAFVITLGIFQKIIALRQFQYLWLLILVFFMIRTVSKNM